MLEEVHCIEQREQWKMAALKEKMRSCAQRIGGLCGLRVENEENPLTFGDSFCCGGRAWSPHLELGNDGACLPRAPIRIDSKVMKGQATFSDLYGQRSVVCKLMMVASRRTRAWAMM